MLLFGAAALPVALPQEERGAETDAPEYFKAKLIGVSTFYGQERWKANPGLYGSNPSGGFTNATGQYDGAVGYRVSLKVELTDEDGSDVDPTDTELPFVNMTAYIDSPRGRVYAWVQREQGGTAPAGLSASPVFHLHFDMDGTNFAPPGGTAQPAFPAGLQRVHVDIKKGSGGGSVPAGSSDLVFDYSVATQDVQVSNFAGVYVTDAPDTIFRLFNDIGWGSTVRMVDRPVPPTETVTVAYGFPATNATVQWWALAAQRLCNPPGCVPGGPGTIEIHRKLLDDGLTDGTGQITFSAAASTLLQYPAQTYAGGAMVVLAATLDPASDLGANLPDEFALGSSQIRTGATELVVPVSDARTRVTGFSLNTSAYERAQGSGAPGPVEDLALQANALEVTFYDDEGTSNAGDAVAFRPNAPGSTVFTRADIGRHSDPTLQGKYRVARLLAKPIQDQHVTNYRVMGLLYGPSPNDFYSVAYADRGFLYGIEAPVAYVGDRGTVWFNLTSVTTNYDLRTEEPGFDLRVLLEVTVPDLQVNSTEVFNLREGARDNRPFPVTADRVADVKVNFVMTSGDTLSDPGSVTARFIEQPPPKSFVDRIPGFELVGALVVLGALAWRAARRTR